MYAPRGPDVSDSLAMLKFEPLVARLVEDVLRALRDATLDEVRDLAQPATAAPRPRNLRSVVRDPVDRRGPSDVHRAGSSNPLGRAGRPAAVTTRRELRLVVDPVARLRPGGEGGERARGRHRNPTSQEGVGYGEWPTAARS